VKLSTTLQFSIVLQVIIIFSIDPVTSLIADRIYKPDYRNFIVFEDRNRKDRSNYNQSENVKKNILLVDDEPDLTFSFKEGLGDAGYNVDVFNNSMHALENFSLVSMT
jgi:hypothetical protein